ncbi:MAG: sterol desaturase family protein [Chitinophagaceae bacterium]|nr:sterol desaturase family protein [Chitinophagaceae bacterium]
MEKFVSLFEHAKPWHLLMWIAFWMLIFGLLENVLPNFSFKYNRKRHAGVNLSFLITTAIVNIAIGIITAGAYLLIQEHKIGLIYWIEMPLWVQLIVCLLLLDFIGMYCSHYVLHRFKWFWKFHMVHHSDTHVDVTTGTRHHPGDWFLREMFALVAVFLTGAPVAFYFIFRFVNVVFTYLTHANISLPAWLEKPLSWIFVTPNVHKFHHHVERPWTDTNFGNIFSIWDRLLGTFVYDDITKVRYGLDVLEGKPDEDVIFQLKLPFNKTVKTDY